MAKATLVSRVYGNRFDAQTTSFLIGNVGDIIDLTLQFDVEITSTSSTGNAWTITNNTTITRTIGSWYDEGYLQGGAVSITLLHNSGVKSLTATILTLSPTIMVLTALVGDTLENGVYPDTAAMNGLAYMGSDEPIEGIEFKYNLTSNTQAQSGGTDASIIDGGVTIFKSNQLDATDPTLIDLTPYGERSGMAILSSQIKGLGISGGVQSFELRASFMILPDWELTSNFTTGTKPSNYSNQECLSDYIYCKFLPQAANPNIFVETSTSQTALLGNTGWFDENYNGGANKFATKLGSSYLATFANELNTLTVPDVLTTEGTNFRFFLVDNGANANREYKIGFLWLPDDTSLYFNKLTPFHENLLYCGAGDVMPLQVGSTGLFTGYTNADGARMDIQINAVTIPASDAVIFEGLFKPNAAFNTFMQTATVSGTQNTNYLIWISAGDETLSTLNSDRVSVIAKFGELQTSTNSYEQFNVTNSFLNHAQLAAQVGTTDIVTCVEDEVMARSVIKVDTAQQEFIEEITFSIDAVSNQPIGFNTGLSSFNVETTTFDCTGFPKDAQQIQQIDIDTIRGFKMATGVEKNQVKIFRSPIDDSGTLLAYKALYSFRPRWEDWQQNLNVDGAFYDNAELNKGFNNDWSRFDNPNLLGGLWRLQYSVKMRINRGGTIVYTQNPFKFSVRDYEESTVWDGAITTYNVNKSTSLFIGVNADGIRENGIIADNKTWVEADFDLEDVMGDVGSVSDYFGVIRMEEYRNGGIYKIDMLSNVIDNENITNFLIPLTGETATKITKVSATKIRLECYVDNTKRNSSVSTYKLSARLGISNINLGKYSRHYSIKYN